MNIKSILVAILLMSYFSLLSSQTRILEKTEYLISKVNESDGVKKLQAYEELLNYYIKTNPPKAIELSEIAISLAEKTNNNRFKAKFLLLRGLAYTKINEPNLSTPNYIESYRIAESINDEEIMCDALIRIGASKIAKQGINLAIEDFIKVENIASRNNDKFSFVDATNYLAIAYYLIDDYSNAIKFSEKALKICNDINYVEGKALAYEHITIVKIKLEKYDEALEFNQKALELRTEIDDLPSIAGAYYNYAVIFNRLKDFNKAIDYTKQSIEIRKKIGNLNGVGSNYLTLGNIFIKSNQPDSALVYLNKAYEIKNGSGDIRTITSIVKSLSDLYEKKNDFKKAHSYLRQYKAYTDSIFSDDSRRISSKILAQQEFVRKEAEIKHLQDVNSYQKKIQAYLIITIVLISAIITVLIIFYLNNKKVNKKLVLQNLELTALNRDREKFFKIISHDLRSPFHPIIGFSDMLIKEAETISRKELKELLININISSKKIYDLLDNLLQWLGMNTKRMELTKENFNLTDEVISTIKLFENNLTVKNIRLINKIEKNLYVFADRSAIGVVLRNALSNAIKFSVENGDILLTSELKGNFAYISIKDRGVGIDQEKLNTLFTVEMKSSRGTRNESGTGLGLILCKEMIERNGGIFSINSSINTGTTVTFSLQLSRTNEI